MYDGVALVNGAKDKAVIGDKAIIWLVANQLFCCFENGSILDATVFLMQDSRLWKPHGSVAEAPCPHP